jgi:hypothetical protein
VTAIWTAVDNGGRQFCRPISVIAPFNSTTRYAALALTGLRIFWGERSQEEAQMSIATSIKRDPETENQSEIARPRAFGLARVARSNWQGAA